MRPNVRRILASGACRSPGARLLATEALEALADRLLGSAPVDARGIAQLQLLLRDSSSPLYYRLRAGDLEQALREADDALEPTP